MAERKLLLQLLAFIFGPAIDVLHLYFETVVLHKMTFKDFLNDNKNKHILFHEYIPTIPCCECIKTVSIAATKKHKSLNESQFRQLYDESGTITPNHQTNKRNAVLQHCLCKVSARQVTPDDLDITLTCSVLGQCCPNIFGQCTWLSDIRNSRNSLTHNNDGEISDIKFKAEWQTLENAVLGIAGQIGSACEKQYRRQIRQLNNKSVEELQSIIEETKDNISELRHILNEVTPLTIAMQETREIIEKVSTVQHAHGEDLRDIRSTLDNILAVLYGKHENMQTISAIRIHTERPDQEGAMNECNSGTDSRQYNVLITIRTPASWNKERIKEKLSAILLRKEQPTEDDKFLHLVDFGFQSLILKTWASHKLIRDRSALLMAISVFLEKIFKVCEIDTSIPDNIFIIIDVFGQLKEEVKEETVHESKMTVLTNIGEIKYRAEQTKITEMQNSQSAILMISIGNCVYRIELNGLPTQHDMSDANIEIEKETCYLQWIWRYRDDWNLKSFLQNMKNKLSNITGWFSIDFVYIDSFDRLVLETSTQRHVMNNIHSVELVVKPFLEQIVDVCELKFDKIADVYIDVTVLSETAKDEAKEREYFTKPLGSRTCIEGESVQFECEVLHDNQATLWFKDGTQLSTSDKYNVQRHGRLHRLVVNSTQLDDQGQYLVKIKNCFLTSTLIVQEYFTKPLVTMTCIEGDCVQFECEVLHVNQRALWFKNGTEVGTSNKYKVEQLGKRHILIVNNTRLDDQGEYSVKIKNCVRRSQLVVQVYFTKPLVTVTCIEGDSVQFECEVPQINQTALWFKDDTDVRTADKYKVERNGRLHRLVVNNTKLDDQGEYSVKIKNCMRRSELIVQEYFSTPLESRTSCLEGESVQFECEVLQINQIASWFKDGTEVRISEKYKVERHGRLHKLVVHNTKLDDQGEYAVKIKDCVRRSQLIVEEIPASFRHLSKEDKGLYLEIMKSGTETRYYIRILIIGENGVGKTCLLRRLLGETIEDVTSTDGIDIVHRCKIRLSDGQWIIDKGSNTRKELMTRMRRALNAKSYDDEHMNIEHKQMTQSSIAVPSQSDTSKDQQQTQVKKKSIKEKMEDIDASIPNTDSKRQGSHEGFSLPKYELRKSITDTHELEMTREKIEPILDTILTEKILNELSKFLNDIKKSEVPNEILVECGFWDFAGQRHYYPTHPIFLNRNSVHLLVADIMKDMKQINTEGGYDKIGEYIDFWFDSIHSCGAVEPTMDSTGDYLNPPVIVVCTGVDKCKDQLDIRKNEFRKQLLSILQNEDKLKHLRRICCISNMEPSDADLDYIRRSIFEFGKNIETFGEKLPIRWIQLEQILEVVREADVNILSWPDMADLASKCSINDEKEVRLFLKYHHKVGTIIYFESLKEYIILNQQWLADAFRCLVSDRYDDDTKLTPEWKTLEDTGELKLSLISKLFLKEPEREFYKHEGHLLKLMEMFGIIVKLLTLSEDGQILSLPTYYMPCMISDKTSISQIYDAFSVKKDNCTPWLFIEFDFMPFDFYTHVICQYVRKYPVCSEAVSRRMAIYHGVGVFFLDKFRKLVVCFTKNAIALQIWQWKQLQDGKCKEMIEELKSVINNVKNKYEPRRVSYTIKAKCCNGSIHVVAGRLSYTDLVLEIFEGYLCAEHNEVHDTEDFFQTWFEDYSENDDYMHSLKTFKGTEYQRLNQICHVCDKERSVYWCHDCQRSMCKDCNNQHKESDKSENHIVQHVQDEYTLDYKVELNVQLIIDLTMLNDGLLVVGDWGGKQLVTSHISRQEQPNFISLPDDPYFIAVVDNNTVAVSLPKIDALVVVDVRKKEEIHRFNLKVGTGGLMYRDNQFFIGHSKTIKVINMSGEVTSRINLAVIPRYIYGAGDGHIYCTDEDKLHCLDKDGNHVFTLSDPDMQLPVGIAIDDEGHLLVISKQSSNVIRISPDGKQRQIVLSQIPFTCWFSYILYDSVSRSIVFGSDKTVYVYKKV